MPEYNARITEGSPNFTRLDLRNKWMANHEGEWIVEILRLLSKAVDPKTRSQLGYYWGLLFPEIHAELLKLGHTSTVRQILDLQIPITKPHAHEIITNSCGFIGNDGKHIRLSGCDKFDGINWLNNVLEFARMLSMDTDLLRAKGEQELRNQ